MRRANSLVLIALLVVSTPAVAPMAAAQQAAARVTHALAEEPVTNLTLVKASDGAAVIRGSSSRLEKVSIGDLVGATRAVVKEISSGRIVLEEAFTEMDGKPNRALIVIKEGERGGTRYLQRAGEPAITGTKPLIVMPAAPASATPTPKKPPQM